MTAYGPEDFAAEIGVSRETLDRLKAYEESLRRWQPRINLVSRATLPDLWRRHMLDSGQLLAHAPAAATRFLDLGTGAGFPGLVLAILLRGRKDARVVLVESDRRKCAFLQHVARETGASAEIHPVRIESLPTALYDVITARALAPLNRLLGYAAPFAGPETQLLFLKGRDVHHELAEASASWSFDAQLFPSRSDPAGNVLSIARLRHA